MILRDATLGSPSDTVPFEVIGFLLTLGGQMPPFKALATCRNRGSGHPLAAIVLSAVCLIAASGPLSADDTTPDADNPETVQDSHVDASGLGGLDVEGRSEWWIPVSRDLGIEWVSKDGRFSLNPWLRGQFRFSDPFDADPRRVSDFDNPPGADLEVRRARLKVEGQLGSPDITFYVEHELSGDHPLLDFRIDLGWRDWLRARVGQYKVLYNRERVDSSGKQSFAERSISTYAFTLDRQRGITLAGEWAADTRSNQWLMLGVFEGDSRDPGPRGDGMMYVGRWQWAFLGKDLPFSQSDLQFRSEPAATLAFGAASVEGPYTRFSSSGGGQLDDFTVGGDDRYELTQMLQEFAWHWNGYAFQQEFHVKRIYDNELESRSTLRGGYAQLGKVWNAPFGRWGLPVELAIRYAQVDWNDSPLDRVQKEITIGGNLFFRGHNNKLTADVSRLLVDEDDGGSSHDIRLRLQWDVSF